MEELEFDKLHTFKEPAPKRSRRRFYFLLAFIVFLAVVFGFRSSTSNTISNQQKEEITPSPTEYIFPTEEPQISPTEIESNIGDPIDKATGLDRSDVSIDVQNGSGEKLVASKASEVLKGLGYHVISLGNADNFNYEGTTIKIKEKLSKYLPLLKKDLSDTYFINNSSMDLPASSSADVLIIIGK